MPLYEYRCTSCDRQIEVIQSFSDKPLRKCEECGGKLEKLVSRSGFVLKGSGWYASDYKTPAKSSSKDDAGGSDEASASGADSKDSKDAKKDVSKKGGGTKAGKPEKASKGDKAATGTK